LESQLVDLHLQRESLLVRSRALTIDATELGRLSLPVVSRQVREIEEEIAGLEKKVASLELRAPRAGIVRTPRPAELVGRYFGARQPILEVGGGDKPRLLIALDEQQARKVRPGQPVRVMFTGLSGEVFEGEILSAPSAPAATFSAPSMANLAGGDAPSEQGAAPGVLYPSLAYYEAEAMVEIPAEKIALLRAQSSGRARIEISRTSVAGRVRDRFFEMVNPGIRL
jgi:hypothetical protein